MAKTELFARKQAGGMFIVNREDLTTGDIFFVDSVTGADTVGSGQNPDSPTATIDFAVGLCTANKGDKIYVMPGHAETIAAAAGLDLDVAGISVIGLGNGTNRPTLTFTATASDVDVDAANILVRGLVFINNIDALVAPIDVNAAYFTMEDCELRDDTAAKQTVRWILGDAAADYMTIRRCINHGSDTAGATAWITLNGSDHPVIEDCTSHGDFSAGNIETVTAACTDVLFTRNHLENANAVDVNIEGFAAQTGWISYNAMLIPTDTQVTWINTPGSAVLVENYGANQVGEAGILAGTPSV